MESLLNVILTVITHVSTNVNIYLKYSRTKSTDFEDELKIGLNTVF